jgi:hypothetical protein
MSAKVFAADGDTAEFPEDFDQLIVFQAMKKYGLFHAATEVLERGQRDGMKLMRQLESDQLPPVAVAAPLA